MTNTLSNETTLHPFEAANLGQAPFRLVGIRKNVYSAAPGHSQPGGCCSYCSQGILWECVIRSHDGKVFAVGQDCVRKLDRDDNRLVDAVKRELARIAREERDAAREARWEARRREIEAELDRQRVANGGLTDSEVQQQARETADAEARAVWRERNWWLISVLQGQSGEFCCGMCDSLERGPISSLSDRCRSILTDIYAKSHGRRGSKKYDAAVDDFAERASASGG